MSLQVVCINNDGQKHIQIGKVYTALNNSDDFENCGLEILNENNDIVFYNIKRFVTIEEYRDRKINEILYEK
jgi:hypothetical protein